jgi:cyanophycinase
MQSKLLLAVAFCFFNLVSSAQSAVSSKGKLFIIGGGSRPPELTKAMIDAADLGKEDYIAVLPMSSAEKDTSVYYFQKSVQSLCSNAVVNLDFTAATVNNRSRLDSLAKAKLIYIPGGQQTRFMDVVLNTPVYDAIHKAFQNGAMVAGTSAGAAVMSEQMITGTQLSPEASSKEGFTMIKAGNVEFKKGLGLVTTAIIDQHFIVRSRYNRLLTALQTFPSLTCIGIDESTAILVEGNKVTVAGEGQVIVLSNPKGITVAGKGLIGMKKVELGMYVKGDKFEITAGEIAGKVKK